MLVKRACVLLASAAVATCLAKPGAAAESASGDAASQVGADLEGALGSGVLATGSGTESLALLGAQARLRIALVQVAGFAERSQAAVDTVITYGGVAGVWLSPADLPDFDLGLGLARRTYAHDTPGGAIGDYALSTPAVVARCGVSDRAFRQVGARLGARLSLSWDTRRHERQFEYGVSRSAPGATPRSDPTLVQRSRHVGGVSVVLSLTIALDVTAAAP